MKPTLPPLRVLAASACLVACAYAALRSEAVLLKNATDANAGVDERTRAFSDLQAVASETVIPSLASLLVDPVWSHPARLVLEPMPAGAADRALIAALAASHDDAVRAGLATSLGARRSGEAVKAIASLLGSTTPALVEAALDALGRIATPAAADALLAHAATTELKTIWADAALQAAEMLRAANAAKSAELYRAVKAKAPLVQAAAAWMGLARTLGRPEGEIVAALRSADTHARTAALAVIRSGEFGPSLTVAVGEALASLAASVQVQALAVLYDRADRAAAPLARRALTAGNRDVSAAAAKLLSVIGDASDAPALLSLMVGADEPAPSARLALTRIPGPETTALLVGAFRQGGAGRDAALEVLVARGHRALVVELLQPAVFADDAFRPAAANALLALGTGADLGRVLAFHRALPIAQRPPLETALRRIAAKAPAPDAAAGVVFAAAEQLPLGESDGLYTIVAGIGGEAALTALTKLLTSPELERRKAGIRAFGGWRDASPAEKLLQLARSESDANTRALAVRAATTLFTRGAFAGNATVAPANVPAAIAGLRAAWAVAEQSADKDAVNAALRSLKTPEAVAAAQELEKNGGTR